MALFLYQQAKRLKLAAASEHIHDRFGEQTVADTDNDIFHPFLLLSGLFIHIIKAYLFSHIVL